MRQSRTHLKNLSTSVPQIRKSLEGTEGSYKVRIPCQLVLSAKDRSSKIHLQNFRVNEELRKNMKRNIQRQRRALNLSIQSYMPQVSEGNGFTSAILGH